ncbi:MAG: hypothetical protein N2323_03620 [candidate division WOR-3 bacterium]|nr:hypothetical protein [candidate division WOR-3 bacterium]MCX7837030.1 hypothetical protein [candidate division WOR-3 bacterium]MDW8114401.1 hypothetical protein [candidate division WOR-3 bacterium]
MAHAYIPGLKVTDFTLVRKERRLPLPGEILVKIGEEVKGEDIVAKTYLPGNVQTINVAGLLNIPPEDIREVMVKKEGDDVEKDEVIAYTKSFFGLFKSYVRSPVKGKVESISEITGQVIIREPPQPVQVSAYIDGIVKEIIQNEGVVIETYASLVQGIFGIGGETRGILKVVVSNPNEVLTEKEIDEDCEGKILIGGSLVTAEALKKAREIGAKGIVVGGIEDETIKNFLGYDIGVAITGQENCNLTLVITEGFGRMKMAERTFSLLKSLEGKIASMNGATQIRAGVIRPEVIVAKKDGFNKDTNKDTFKYSQGLEIGTPVRIIREPYFGMIGKVVSLPVELQKIETESYVRVLEVELEDKRRVIIPRANVEIIEI